MTPKSSKSKSLELLMEELCVLLHHVLGSEAGTDMALKIQELISEMTGIRLAMERHAEMLTQAAAEIKTARVQAQNQDALFEEMKMVSHDIAWIRAQLSQKPFAS
jgi:hypothetical protein